MKLTDWPADWTVRPATFDDVELAVDMFNARSRKFYGENQSTSEDMVGWWKSPRFDLACNTRIVLDEAGRMAGWGHVANPGEPYVSIGCGVITHPAEEENQGMWDRLFGWALERAQEYVSLAPPSARVVVHENAGEADAARRSAAERAGFEMVRVENIMRIDLDTPPPVAEWPAGIGLRVTDIGQDLAAMVEADGEACRDHWGFVEEPFEQRLEVWQSWIESLGDAHDPSLWFIAHDGDQIAGLGLFSTQIAGDKTRSYVDSLSVRPAYRKRGIALALLRHGFGELYRRGYAAVELDMDSENLTGALRLYERAGMRVIRRKINYEKVLRDGEDLTTRELAA